MVMTPAERKRAYNLRKKIEKYGPENAHVDMRGRHGNHATGERNARFSGGRFQTSHGYIAVRVPPTHPHAWGAHPRVKYAYEHILVAEEKYGRPLAENESVHHLNAVKTDNRPENLVIVTRSEHARDHDEERGRDTLGRFRGGRERAKA